MGLLRLILAVWVLVAHSGGTLFGLRFAGPELAVETFFIISGFYMALILSTRYRSKAGAFYFNRFLRLFPSYWIALAVFLGCSGAYWIATGHARYPWVGWNPSLGSLKVWFVAVFANLLIVGTDIFSWFHGGTYFSYVAIPPIWSVAIEIIFYLFAPLVVRARLSLQWGLFLAGLVIRGRLAARYGVTFAPTTVPFFLAGILSYRLYTAAVEPFLPGKTWSRLGDLLTLVLALGVCFPSYFVAREPTWYFALVSISLPLVFAASKDRPWDAWVAQWSYPIYLCHWLLLILYACVADRVASSLKVYFVLALTVALAAFVLYCDGYIQRKFKRKL